MDQWDAQKMINIRTGLCIITVLSFAVQEAASAAPPMGPGAFSSPADFRGIKKIPHINIVEEQDHSEINYPGIAVGKDVFNVVESRWEDGSRFEVYDHKKAIFRLPEASPYWAYSSGSELRIYFVDDSLGPDGDYYRDLEYLYTSVVISNNSVVAEDCHYKFQPGDGKAVRAQLDRRVDNRKLNPMPPLISRVLSKGVARPSDDCKPARPAPA